uniref:Uncharacterized protein n=1 Tax=Arundo donax TaxID=35708 RepID=A0A0A9EMD9_ARUDO
MSEKSLLRLVRNFDPNGCMIGAGPILAAFYPYFFL